MEVAEPPNGCRLAGGGSGVAAMRWDNHGDQPNGDVLRSETNVAPDSPPVTFAVFDNDDWTQRRPESVWLEYLYEWNPLAAGSRDNRFLLFKRVTLCKGQIELTKIRLSSTLDVFWPSF